MLLTVGIIITVVSVLMVVFPQEFTKHKNQRIPQKLLRSPKMIPVLRAWGSICAIAGVVIIAAAIIQ